MARGFNSRTVSIDDGVLSFDEPGFYRLDFNRFAQLNLEGGQSTNLLDDVFDGVTEIDISEGVTLSVAAADLIERDLATLFDLATIAGTLDIRGVEFTGAAGGGGDFEATPGLDGLLNDAINASDIGTVVGNLTVNGTSAGTFQLLWELLDDDYVATGPNNVDVNEQFVRLGIEYVNYLEAGGDPLTFVSAKFTADDEDANATPERAQSMHDNLLGNLNAGVIESRFDSELASELLGEIPADYQERAVFSGNEAAYGGADHDDVREFDYDRGWDRPDYIETSFGLVDERASEDRDGDGTDEQMAYGSGNSNDFFNVVRHEGAGVELALKAKKAYVGDYDPGVIETEDGVPTYTVSTGPSAVHDDRAEWSIDYAATVLEAGDDDSFNFKLFIDLDPSEGEDFVEYPMTTYDGLEQGSLNYGFGFLGENIDTDPDTEGTQPYADGSDGYDSADYGEGTFSFRLEAHDDGELIASNKIVVEVQDDLIV